MWLVLGAAAVLIIFLSLQYGRYSRKRRRLTDAVAKIPGPTDIAAPIVWNVKDGALHEWSTRGQFDKTILCYQQVMSLCKVFQDEGIYKFWIGYWPFVVVFSPEMVESLLSAPHETTKSMLYFQIKPWLRDGLVTSNGVKWHSRRRITTPAFHFNILNDFLPAIDANATKFVRKLNNVKYTGQFNCSHDVNKCTLDIICETAMGIETNFQGDANSEWEEAIDSVTRLGVYRLAEIWAWPDATFFRSQMGKQYVKSLEYLHSMSMKVIQERKVEWEQRMEGMPSGEEGAKAAWSQPTDGGHPAGGMANLNGTNLGTKVRAGRRLKMAFLDLMLYQHLVEKSLSITDVQEEVDTFMFAGQDTTSVTISWALYMLGLHQDVQNKVRCELNEIFGHNDDLEIVDDENDYSSEKIRPRIKLTKTTTNDLSRMKYLEMVIKETLRYWPTIPNVSRQLTKDMLFGGKYLVPAGTTVNVQIHALHWNPSSFPNPHIFDPNRFLPENISRRHPYAFVPFSAGPRNCVGQRFAMMEVKVVLAKIVRNYRIVSDVQPDKLRVVGQIVIKSEIGQPIRLMPLDEQ